jgi:hypothetical protein
MFAPDGSVRSIPDDQVGAALQAGGKRALQMKDPQGTLRYVPEDQVGAAQQAGGTLIGADKSLWQRLKDFANTDQTPGPNDGAVSRFIGNFAQGIGAPPRLADYVNGPAQMLQHPIDSASLLLHSVSDAQQQTFDKAKAAFAQPGLMNKANAAGYAVESMIPVIGPAMANAGEQLASGDVSGALGKTAGITTGLAAASPEARAAAADAAKAPVRAASDAYTSMKTAPQRAVMANTIANMPMKAVDGAEDIIRAAAPPGGEATFRKSAYTAAGDLAEIGRDANANITAAKGGTVSPDMRVRAVVNATNDHLQQMYQQERAPQIARNADAPVVMNFGTDASDALQNIAKNGSTAELRALAGQAISEKVLPLSQVDALARAVNQETAPLRGLTSQQLAQVEGGSRNLAAAKALDSALSDKIATELQSRGEGGIQQYEQRYAALSDVRDQLQKRMNMVELQRSNPVKKAIEAIGLVRDPMAGASQAATAKVNIGQTLQNGLQKLADSGMVAKRAVGSGAPPVKGLLGTGNTQLPSAMDPIGQPSAPPPVLRATDRIR